MKRKTLLIICLLCAQLVIGQRSDWKHKGQINFGCNLAFHYGGEQRYPGLKVFAGFGINSVYKEYFVTNYGSSFSFYTKTLGANINPLVGDVQFDFINSFSLGASYGESSYVKHFRTINNTCYYNAPLQSDYALLFGSNFILNRCKRNQVVGSISLTAGDFTVNYYNDGAVPVNWKIFALGDNFDRWWTGGFGFFFHNNHEYNTAEFTFDQFTGYEPLLYELSNVLGIDVPAYGSKNEHVGKNDFNNPATYNTSAYNLKVYLDKGYAVDAGIMGSLRWYRNEKRPVYWGLQDVIHILQGYSLHPNYDPNRFYLGGTYNNMRDVEFK